MTYLSELLWCELTDLNIFLIALALETTADTLPSVTLLQSGFSKSMSMVSKYISENLYLSPHDI